MSEFQPPDYATDPAVQAALDMPWAEVQPPLSGYAAGALRGAQLLCRRDVLVAGNKTHVRGLGVQSRGFLMRTLAELPIQLQERPTPEHVATFCNDLDQISAPAFLRNLTGESYGIKSSASVTIEDLLERAIKPHMLESLRHKYQMSPYNPVQNPVLFKRWYRDEAPTLVAVVDQRRLRDFYDETSMIMGDFVERFEAERERLNAPPSA